MIPFRTSELRILRKRERLPASMWAERERVLTRGPAPGPWRNSRNPAAAGVMDTLCQPWIRMVVIAKGVQTGLTDAVFNFLGREADYSSGGDAALVVLADEKSVRKHAENRIRPMVFHSKSLREIVDANGVNLYRIPFKTGFAIEIGWATSEISLASETYRIVIMDEYDKYRSMLNAREAEKRTRTLEDLGKKIVKLSNPGEEGGPISEALGQCDVICDYQVPCQECGEWQVMLWEYFRWPGQVTLDGEVVADAKTVRRLRSAWYECPHCQARWNDFIRDAALRAGKWVPRHDIERPYAVGFHFPAWISPFDSLSSVVAEWLEAQDSPELLRAWYNKQAGLPYSNVSQEELTAAEELHKRRYSWWPEGAEWRVPQRACLVVVSVDVQDNRLECKTWAVARGFETWLIDAHIIPGSPASEGTLASLDEYVAKSWLHESGARLAPAAVAVDTGGHFTRTMYQWLRKNVGRRIFGVKGASRHDAPLTQWSLPSRKQRRHVPLLLLNTTILKNDIHAGYKVPEHGPGYLHWPEWMDYATAEQLTSEKPVDQRDKRGNKVRYWLKKKPQGRNEALDLLVYAWGLVHYLNPDWTAFEKAVAVAPPVVVTNQQTVEKPEQKKAGVLSGGRRIYSKGVNQ